MTLAAVWYGPEQMAARAPQWRELAALAVEPNVFAEADYVLPALRHLGDRGVRFLAVERGGRLAGLLPVRLERWRWGLPLALAVHHIPYAPHGTPLVEAEGAQEVCAALLGALAALPRAPRAVLLPLIDESGAFAAAWRAGAGEARAIAAFDAFSRPALRPDPGAARADYLATRLSKERRRRTLGAQRRIERELGPLVTTVARTPEEVAAALETFMAVEASGWKGRRGTAVGARADTAAFFRESLTRLAAGGRIDIVTLSLPEASFASAVLARADGRVWFYKTAYDERFARFSPGVALDLVVTERLLADPSVALGDSLATAPDPGFERLWRERLPMADWLTAVAPASNGFQAAKTLETVRRAGRARAKALVEQARERFGS